MTYDSYLMLDDVGDRITAKSAGSVVAGDLVGWASGTDCVGSRITTFADGDLVVAPASGTAATALENVVGIALQSAASGTRFAVALGGLFILPAGSNGVSGGMPVSSVGYANCVEKTPTGSLAATAYPLGRALTSASAAGTFAVVRVRF